jgi:uncharacterized membrane protein
MADDETTFIFVAVYDSEEAAQEDYDVVKELYAAKAIGNFDAAVIRKDADGKVHVNKDETATRKGAWGGAAVGAVVGILFPPSLLATAGVGALAGGLGGHFLKGMSRKDVKEMGDYLDSGEVALLVVGDWQLDKAIDKAFSRAIKKMDREVKSLERKQLEEDYAAMLSGGHGE